MAAQAPVRDIYEHTEVRIQQVASPTQRALPALNQSTFKDQRWENAVDHLRASGHANEESVRQLLLQGARAFGMWSVSQDALQALTSQVLEDVQEANPSTGLQSWISLSREAALAHQEDQKAFANLKPSRMLTLKGDPKSDEDASTSEMRRKLRTALCDRVGLGDAVTLVNRCLAFALIAVCLAYASWVVWVKYDGIFDMFSWPIFFARAGGLATAIITGLLYLTMARTSMKQVYKVLSVNSKMLVVMDGHKDIHLFLAGCLGVASIIHVVAHLLATVPALQYDSAEQLNSIIACADREHKLKGWPSLAWLQWPACPLKREHFDWEQILLQTTIGLSGVVLVALLLLLGWTGRAKARSQKFDRFWYAHNFILVVWPVAMFVHGSNQWIGVGFPLVVFTATVPICLYMVDRVARLLRYYLYSGTAVRIADAVIRPGKDGGPSGALTHLVIEKPPGLWNFAPGMYAFINMPEYAPLQWHPFTICSGRDDKHVEFIIASVGDWTCELAAKCLDARSGHVVLPRVALDGPYAAPTQSALSRPIFVAVGAGVGITPFLSLMSSLISVIEGSSESEREALPLKEAHFFWMTRSADEFLFGRKHFTRIASSPLLRQKIHLHLHNTGRQPEGDAAAYIFRQAVKRQSKLDRATFAEEFDERRVLMSPQLPWCWVNKSQLDIMWLSDLTTAQSWAEDIESSSTCHDIIWEASQCAALPEAAEEGRAGVRQASLSHSSCSVPVIPEQPCLAQVAVERGDARRPSTAHGTTRAPSPEQPGPTPDASPAPAGSLRPPPSAPTLRVGTPSAASVRSGHSVRSTESAAVDWAQELLWRRCRRSTTTATCGDGKDIPASSLSGSANPARLREDDCSSLRGPVARSSWPSSRPRTTTTSSCPSCSPRDTSVRSVEAETLVPVAFGRPDFHTELRSIGKHWHSQEKVHIYVCGSDAIVQGLQSAADVLNAEALANGKVPRAKGRKYIVAYERFG